MDTKPQGPRDELFAIAKQSGVRFIDEEFAKLMDKKDPLRHLRNEFYIPKMKDLNGTDLSKVDPEEECVYFAGLSLGLCPKSAQTYLDKQMDNWRKRGVQSYFIGEPCLVKQDEDLDKAMAKLVGALEGEVVLMNSLTVNLHLMLISFYRPNRSKHKILCEDRCFPSDYYAFESQIRLHGFDPETSLIVVTPREGEELIQTEDILTKIEQEGDSIAVVCFSGVNYYTGQAFDMEKISQAGHAKGCYVGYDLAHAVGNIELYLHDWNVDFACWCNYKYMNASPGAVGAAFIHNKHDRNNFPKLQGWWGHKDETRFNMEGKMDSYEGAYAYRISNTSGLVYPPLKASLEIFQKTSMTALRMKSKLLVSYLEQLILITNNDLHPDNNSDQHFSMKIITPSDPDSRGSQLSIQFTSGTKQIFEELGKRGVMVVAPITQNCDVRMPFIIRVAPVPLYCSFHDVYRFMLYLSEALQKPEM